MASLAPDAGRAAAPQEGHGVSLGEAFHVWLRVALLSFGGPAGQIAVMHRILVEEKRWISEVRFLHALNYCMLLPGPEAHELAIYIGWLLHRVRGGLIAGVLFVLPGLVSLALLSWIYASFGQVGIVGGLFFGLKAAVLAVVLEALLRIGSRALKTRAAQALAVLAFIGIFFLTLPFPLIIAAAAFCGWLGNRLRPDWFQAGAGHGATGAAGDGPPALLDAAFAKGVPPHVRPSLGRALRVALIGGLLWLGPLVALWLWLGPGNIFTAIAAFNSKMAVSP
jgi:chromate transporter